MPFPIQRFQTDRGREFFAENIQQKMRSLDIKFRRKKLASPHLNGKVERSHKTEFYTTVNIESEDLDEQLAEWQHYYNWNPPHSAHKGKTPMEKYFMISDEALDNYEIKTERIQDANYKLNLEIARLKRSL